MTSNNPHGADWQERAMDELRHIQTGAELDALIGDITPEERALLGSINFDAPLTPEELETLGPDFLQRIQERVMQRIREQQGS